MTHLNQKVKRVKFADDLENDSPDENTQLTREDKEEILDLVDNSKTNNADKKMRRKSDESAMTKNPNIPPNDDWVLASKKEIEAVIRASRRRLKSTESVKRAEDMLLVYREKVLFFDMLCLRISIIKQQAQIKLAKMEDPSSKPSKPSANYIELEAFIQNVQKTLICLLEIGLIYNEQLIKF